MAGLLDYLTDKENPLPLLGLMAMAGVAGSRSKGEAVSNGLQGLLQGVVAMDNKKDEDAKYQTNLERQRQQDEMDRQLKTAQIQHYQHQATNGADPYWTTISTPQGLQKFNARSGEMIQITDASGNPIMKASDSPELQGTIAGVKKNAETANSMFEQEGEDGSKQRFMGNQLPNFQQPQSLQPNFQSQMPQNNNVGNLRNLNGQGFQSFATPEEGQQALSRQIGLYSTKHDVHNLLDFTSRYAPKGDGNNDPVAYAKFLAQQTGIPLDAKNIDFSNPEINAAMTRAIPIMEHGWRSNPAAANKQISQGNAFGELIKQGAQDAVSNGTMTKPQATQMAQSIAHGAMAAATNPFKSQSTAEKLAAETEAKRVQEEQKAAIELKNAAPIASATKSGGITGEAAANAQIGLPQAQADAQSILSTIAELKSHKGLEKGVGASSIFFNKVPGTDAYDFANLHENARGKVFMQAFESLKGAGAITEQEGTAATNAISAMGDLKQSKESYLRELGKLEGVVNGVLQRKTAMAGVQNQPQSVQPSANLSDSDLLNLYRSK
jgi:hypothetical protein